MPFESHTWINKFHSLFLTSQGLYEYVQPKWCERVRPKIDSKFDMKKFGTCVMGLPTLNNQVPEVKLDGGNAPA